MAFLMEQAKTQSAGQNTNGGTNGHEQRQIANKDRAYRCCQNEARAFAAAGGDLKSNEAGPIGVELAEGFNDLLIEFGSSIQKYTK